MRVRVGINGMGRIGRELLRIATGRAAAGDACFEVVAVNDLAQPETVAHLLKHDSTYGAWSRSVDAACGLLDVDGHAIRVLQHPDPEDLPWGDLGVDVVVEATGKFRTRAAAAAQPATAAQVNAAFQAAADAQLKGILRCTDEPVVSHDVIGAAASCLLYTGLTRVAGQMVKVFGWYDNEWGYAQRTADLVEMVARRLPTL